MARLTRRSFGVTLAGVAVQAIETCADMLANDQRRAAIFPFGAHIFRDPALPLAQLRRDLSLLKRLGFTMVKIQESWSMDEQREGQIDLSRVAQVVSDARQQRLGVYFGVTMEQAPAWLWREFPDAQMVYETGEPHNDPTQYLLPSDGKPGPCWHHPGARAAGEKFVAAVGREIGKYDNILIWNVWQEIGFWPMRPGHIGFCYCPNTLAAYRRWLRTRYETLRSLNDTWKTGYGDWDEIDPPRFFTAVPASIDWRYFMDDVYLTEALKWKAEAFRQSDPGHRPILAHESSPVIGSAAGYTYVQVLDVIGSSAYPAWGGFHAWDVERPDTGKPVPRLAGLYHELWDNIMLKFDYVRSSSRRGEFWTAELQGGPISSGFERSRVPDANDIRRWVLGSLAAGSRGICFWNHRAEILWSENYGFGLLDLAGDSTPRAEEAGRLARAINAHADLFAKGEHPRAQVAIVLNEDLWHFVQASTGNLKEHLGYTIRGIYRSLWEQGIPVDFIDIASLATSVAAYKALILPFPISLGEDVIVALKNYVGGGGTLISEACPGRLSKYGLGFATEMAPSISELFGARHKQLVVIREPGDQAKWTSPQRTYEDTVEFRDLTGSGELSGVTLLPAFYLQTYTVSGAKPVFFDGNEVAGCVNEFGKGRAYLFGTLLGHAILSYGKNDNAVLLRELLARAGVKADTVGKLRLRRRVLGNQSAWFLFNTTEHTVEEHFSIAGFSSAGDLLGGDLALNAGRAQVRVEPMEIRCIILAA